ncbi:MAG: hypothetical protein CL868_14355 [Cytophagaceae bacterium]|nr:hypothetical protein [Cytophagaceae bacterium]|tara:strand:+ start:18816 stop:19727 length:912 start_codon:yes stop_codon:yes gene_type:complete
MRKTRTQIMMLNLIKIAQDNGEPELEKSYWNTYYCQQNLVSVNGRFYGKYCKNRFCSLCCSIRKADMINRYKPVMEKWKEPYFLTLTVKSCSARNLSKYIAKFIQGITRIIAKHRKRYQRGNGIKLVGVRSLECNFNPKYKTYNPHFHIITKDRKTAEILLREWLKLWTPKFAKRPAQNIQPVRDLENGLIEIIKYGSKIFTEADLKEKARVKKTVYIYLKALDTILTAMKGKRIFDRFGFDSPQQTTHKQIKPQLLLNYDEWEYNPELTDWQHVLTGETLSGYILPPSLKAILENNINTTLV